MGIIAGFMVPHPPMIVPDIGRGSEAQVADTTAAYERVADEIAALAPETIVITSPHSIMYADYFHISPGKSAAGSFAGFRAPGVRFNEEYDTELVKEILRRMPIFTISLSVCSWWVVVVSILFPPIFHFEARRR